MIELGRRLDDLGARLAYPPTPDLTEAVARRLKARPPRRRRSYLVVALAVAALAAGAVLAASPGARSTLLRWLQIGGVRIERVEDLPVVEVRYTPYFGDRVSLAQARRLVRFRILLPRVGDFDEPDEVYVRDKPSSRAVTLLYGSLERPRLALSQWRGVTIEAVLLKVVGAGTRVEHVVVNGAPGVWMEGAPHLVVTLADGREYWETLYLAGPVLIWEGEGRSFRLEADLSREDALEIARSLR